MDDDDEEVSVTLFEDEGNDGPTQQQQSTSDKYMAKMKTGAGSAASMFQSAFESAREKSKPARTSLWEQTAAATKAMGESAASLAEKTKAAASKASTSVAVPHPPSEPAPSDTPISEETDTLSTPCKEDAPEPAAPPATAASKITSSFSQGWQNLKMAKEKASQSKTAESAGAAATTAATSTFLALDRFGAFIGKSSNAAAEKAKELPAKAPAVIAKVKATTEAGLSGLRTGKWPATNPDATGDADGQGTQDTPEGGGADNETFPEAAEAESVAEQRESKEASKEADATAKEGLKEELKEEAKEESQPNKPKKKKVVNM
jgi:hypothetical protein